MSTYVVGVGMTKFEKPGKRDWDYPDMGIEAAQKALLDAGLDYGAVQQVYAGYVYGDSTCGQRVVYGLGMTGVPVINVNNNCSTGSSALFLARQAVKSGAVDCAMAIGFEKMQRGSLKAMFEDRTNPMDKHMMEMMEKRGFAPAPPAPQLFGNAGVEYCERFGATPKHMAKIAHKNHAHSVNNPYSQFMVAYSLDEIEASPTVFGPLTKLQCCPTSEGGACAIIVNDAFIRRQSSSVQQRLRAHAVRIDGMAMRTDFASTFDAKSSITLVGADMSRAAAEAALSEAGYGIDDVQVIELHDCFSANELITYDALGLCAPGEAHKLVDAGDNTYGGRFVVNPSGGLESKGHPLGATGLAQCAELCWQLRGQCGARQVTKCRHALQHNIGLGGAAVVACYSLAFPDDAKRAPQYDDVNPAVSADLPKAVRARL